MSSLSTTSRIEVVDAIRGVAVAMILLLHSIEHFNLYNQADPASPLLQLADRMVWDALWFCIGGKAYAIFALLFGFSFYIMDSHAARRGEDFRRRFCWRMLLLFGFGCLNASFFCGEVLVLYSIVGFILPAVCRLRTRTLLILSAVLMAQPLEWVKLGYALFVDSNKPILVFNYVDYWQTAMKSLSEGNFLQTLRTNLWEGQVFSLAWAWGAGRFCQTASLFILGLVAGRRHCFVDTVANRHLWGRILAVALPAFFALYGLSSLIPDFVRSVPHEVLAGSSLWPLTSGTFLSALLLIVSSLHKFCFMLVIVVGLLFAFYCTRLRRGLQFIMPYGRMSLTNYIAQSVVGAFLYYHWGLFLHLSDTQSVALGIGLLVLQVYACRWWLGRHRRGPLEELWHRLTYLW